MAQPCCPISTTPKPTRRKPRAPPAPCCAPAPWSRSTCSAPSSASRPATSPPTGCHGLSAAPAARKVAAAGGRRLFQSAPAIAGGRCGAARRRPARHHRFNPRPPLLAGDAPRCQGIANSSLFPYRARTPAAPSKGQTKIACEKEKPFGNNTLRSARTCLMQRHHFRFAALTIAWHPCPTAPAAHQNPRP